MSDRHLGFAEKTAGVPLAFVKLQMSNSSILSAEVMKKAIRLISLFLFTLTLFLCISAPVSALSWDGDSEGGGGDGTPAGPNGYALRSTRPDNLIGYRFSVVDRDGNNKVSKVIDVFRNTFLLS